MDAPSYQQPAPDPQLAILTQQTQVQDQAALQTTAAQDTARLAMLYGQATALGTTPTLGSPGTTPDVKAAIMGTARATA